MVFSPLAHGCGWEATCTIIQAARRSTVLGPADRQAGTQGWGLRETATRGTQRVGAVPASGTRQCPKGPKAMMCVTSPAQVSGAGPDNGNHRVHGLP